MTPSVQPDTWTPQVWSHADVLDMQARLDPARMTEGADHWRQVIDGARAVFVRLHEAVTGHLASSWWGHAGRNALEALRGYISEALDGLSRCRSLADALEVLSDASSELRSAIDGLEHVDDLTDVQLHYSDPVVAAGNAVGEIPSPPTVPGVTASALPALAVLSPASTVPAGFDVGTDLPTPPSPSPALHRNGFGDFGGITPTQTVGGATPPLGAAARLAEGPLPTATLHAATMPTGPQTTTAPAPPAAGPPPRGGAPYLPLVGAGYPGAFTRDDGGSRRTPGYLITIDNGNELIGPLPEVAPPVLGEW